MRGQGFQTNIQFHCLRLTPGVQQGSQLACSLQSAVCACSHSHQVYLLDIASSALEVSQPLKKTCKLWLPQRSSLLLAQANDITSSGEQGKSSLLCCCVRFQKSKPKEPQFEPAVVQHQTSHCIDQGLQETWEQAASRCLKLNSVKGL